MGRNLAKFLLYGLVKMKVVTPNKPVGAAPRKEYGIMYSIIVHIVLDIRWFVGTIVL